MTDDWLRLSFTLGELPLDEAPGLRLLGATCLVAIERFNRSLRTEVACRVARESQSDTFGSAPAECNLSSRYTVCNARWKRINESSLTSMCTTVRSSLAYHRVKPSTVSAVPTQARLVRIPQNSNVSTIVLILIALVARVIIHPNYCASIPGGVSS